jgi:hypothetical protein
MSDSLRLYYRSAMFRPFLSFVFGGDDKGKMEEVLNDITTEYLISTPRRLIKSRNMKC